MKKVFIGIGSNINPQENIKKAITLLKKKCTILDISTFYLTPAISTYKQPDYYNGVVLIETSFKPDELKFKVLLKIEESLGRKRTSDKYAPRTIDLDILVYSDSVVIEKDLIIPDPDIYKRKFLTLCLFEISPELILPDTGKKIGEVIKDFKEDEQRKFKPLVNFTQELKDLSFQM